MAGVTIRVDGLWKKFGLTVKDNLRYGLIDSARRLIGKNKDSARLRPGEFWALQNVSFELKRGDALGIMGVNGSGKTTLLRVLNGAFSPDKGRVEMRGRIGALIAAGAGFSPLLTGRENIYVSGSLLGMSREQINRRLDEIVSFSGLEQFIDMPVRNYSSGMSVRLGFAIAVLGEPDILLIDEVLAVGDAAFQKRCYERILGAIRNGTTVVLVSHSVGAVWAVCNKGLFLHKGVPQNIGEVEDTCRQYDLANYRGTCSETKKQRVCKVSRVAEGNLVCADESVSVERIEICDARTGQPKEEFGPREDIMLRMDVRFHEHVPDAYFRYTVDAVHYKYVAAIDSVYSHGTTYSMEPGEYTIETVIQEPRLRPGAYMLNLSVRRKSIRVQTCTRQTAASFVIRPHERTPFLHDSDGPSVLEMDAVFRVKQRDIPSTRLEPTRVAEISARDHFSRGCNG